MKLFSIFGPRPRRVEAAPPEQLVDPALRVAEIFGVPDIHLTPQVRTAFNVMISEIDSLRLDVEQLKLSLAEAEASADHDTLAPIYNRRAFVRETQRILAMVKRHEVQASLIYFDLNNFKAINDAHGHPAGDAVIRAIGEILVRQTRETDVVGRIGGDEFAVILTHTDPEAAASKAEALAATLCTEKVLFNGIPLYVSAAYGITHIGIGDTAEKAIARADEAMYADKALHRRAQAG
ncbi:MAG: GGDEF domain-containing protein [Hyphomonadaceae bacterium]|jgi:diguanylate cyclase (GGDEF)-like protein|nr:GGDEF domain-containing protein [Hyphomonadaceae bacterium]